MGLTVTVLGCSGTYAGVGNACSGYLVRSHHTTVWLDCGPGTLANVQRHIGLDQIDAVVLSHIHPDHWLELPVLRNALKYRWGVEGTPVFGTAEARGLAETVVGSELAPTFDWSVITDGSRFGVGDLAFTCSQTDHPVETLALRIDRAGASLAYSADTGPGWSLADLSAAGPVDLLLCEATLSPEEEGEVQHLSGAQAGVLAGDAGVGRLVLTHLLPGTDPALRRREAEAAFDGLVEVASVGATYTLDPVARS